MPQGATQLPSRAGNMKHEKEAAMAHMFCQLQQEEVWYLLC